MIMKRIAAALVIALAAAPFAAQEQRSSLEWNARTAEHLLNRAGFGASTRGIERAVAMGHEATVAELLRGEEYVPEPFYTRVRRRGAVRARASDMEMTEVDRRMLSKEIRRDDYEQLRDFLSWWVERMVEGDDPLRERMTLFWHGHFTSSMDDVKNSHEMIVQNNLLRTKGMGDFRELVHAIARDPAMLEYLDNDANRRGKPNENFARELMELFTLGEGNYTEEDVKEAARAFTGWSDDDGRFRFDRRTHDYKRKTVLGTTGLLDGDDVIDILVAQDECPRFIAGKILRYFEGGEPSPERVEHYAGVLREGEFEIANLLEELFLDPEFYRDEVVGTRIAGPIDYLVGCARRIGAETPAPLILLGSSLLGQRLLFPPNVKGWEGGRAWITTGTLMQRGNMAGVLLGEVSMRDFLDYDPLEDPTLNPFGEPSEPDGMMMSGDEGMADADPSEEADDEASESSYSNSRLRKRALGELKGLRRYDRVGRRINLTSVLRASGATSDLESMRALCDRLLAVRVDDATCASLAELLGSERRAKGLDEGELFEQPWAAEPILRRVAHVVLSLPEAQLH